MTNNNNKRKGNVYGRSSPISPPSASSFRYKDAISVLNLLPAAILALAAALSADDREVLAYMITRSLLSTAAAAAAADHKKLRCRSKRVGLAVAGKEKCPLFDCGCFDCYTAYWLRWDSSPDRELIHRVIEAFEDHLATGQRQARAASSGRRHRLASSAAHKTRGGTRTQNSPDCPVGERKEDAIPTQSGVPGGPESEALVKEADAEAAAVPSVLVVSPPESGHRGLARKVLPDVVGLLNSRLWKLWNPNV